MPDPSQSPLDALWDEEWERNLMEAAANRVKKKVDPKHYQIFDLCVMKKWPVRKVSSDLRISTAMVYLIKHRIGKLLKKEIDRLKTKHV